MRITTSLILLALTAVLVEASQRNLQKNGANRGGQSSSSSSSSTTNGSPTIPPNNYSGPKIKRTIRVREMSPPPNPANEKNIEIDNPKPINQPDIKLNVATDSPKPSELVDDTSEESSTENIPRLNQIKTITKDANNELIAETANSANKLNRIITGSGNRQNNLLANAGNSLFNLANNNNNNKANVLTNSGNSETVHIDGVGNNKVIKMSNSGNNEIVEHEHKKDCNHNDHQHQQPAVSSSPIINGLPVASPLVQINLNDLYRPSPAVKSEPPAPVTPTNGQYIVPILQNPVSKSKNSVKGLLGLRSKISSAFEWPKLGPNQVGTQYALVQQPTPGAPFVSATPVAWTAPNYVFQQQQQPLIMTLPSAYNNPYQYPYGAPMMMPSYSYYESMAAWQQFMTTMMYPYGYGHWWQHKPRGDPSRRTDNKKSKRPEPSTNEQVKPEPDLHEDGSARRPTAKPIEEIEWETIRVPKRKKAAVTTKP